MHLCSHPASPPHPPRPARRWPPCLCSPLSGPPLGAGGAWLRPARVAGCARREGGLSCSPVRSSLAQTALSLRAHCCPASDRPVPAPAPTCRPGLTSLTSALATLHLCASPPRPLPPQPCPERCPAPRPWPQHLASRPVCTPFLLWKTSQGPQGWVTCLSPAPSSKLLSPALSLPCGWPVPPLDSREWGAPPDRPQ